MQVKWKFEKWYDGTVDSYNSVDHQHRVLYDDDEIRWYHMEMKAWKLLLPKER